MRSKKIVRMTIDELRTNPRRALKLARRDGGVPIVDGEGTLLFSLWFPRRPVPGWQDLGN